MELKNLRLLVFVGVLIVFSATSFYIGFGFGKRHPPSMQGLKEIEELPPPVVHTVHNFNVGDLKISIEDNKIILYKWKFVYPTFLAPSFEAWAKIGTFDSIGKAWNYTRKLAEDKIQKEDNKAISERVDKVFKKIWEGALK